MKNSKYTTMNVRTLMNDLKDGIIDAEPRWQRGDVWTPKMRHDFIETVMDELPIPPISLWKRPAGKSVVVDGRQRITTLGWFMNGKIPIGSKSSIKKYSELTNDEINIFGSTDMTVLVIPETVDEEDIVDYFQRINAGGKKLSHGELMNSHVTTSPIVKEIHQIFFTDEPADFKESWCDLLSPIDSDTKRMAHNENTVPYLTSSMRGVRYLTKSYPVIATVLTNVSQVEVDAHRPVFMAQLEQLLDVLAEIETAVPGWIDQQSWTGGLPLLRQIAAIWYTIICPTAMNGMEISFWANFYKSLHEDVNKKYRWINELRKNAKPAQLQREVDYAMSVV